MAKLTVLLLTLLCRQIVTEDVTGNVIMEVFHSLVHELEQEWNSNGNRPCDVITESLPYNVLSTIQSQVITLKGIPERTSQLPAWFPMANQVNKMSSCMISIIDMRMYQMSIGNASVLAGVAHGVRSKNIAIQLGGFKLPFYDSLAPVLHIKELDRNGLVAVDLFCPNATGSMKWSRFDLWDRLKGFYRRSKISCPHPLKNNKLNVAQM